jgi:DNA polymerase III delta prime subunit
MVKSASKKIIILDTFQELTQDNQNILKSLIKNHVKNVQFILCINDNTHLNENLSQYFINLHLKKTKVNDYKKYISNIFESENIPHSDKLINRIISISDNFHDINNNIVSLIINHKTGYDIVKNYLKILNVNDLIIVNKIINLCLDEPDCVIEYVDKLILNGFSCENIFNSLLKYIYKIKFKSYEKKIFFIKKILEYEMRQQITYTQMISLLIDLCD